MSNESLVGGFTNEINNITETLAKASALGLRAKQIAELQDDILNARNRPGMLGNITITFMIQGRERRLIVAPTEWSHDDLITLAMRICASTIEASMKEISKTVTPLK